MNWIFANDRPIFVQLAEALELKIISGDYPIGTKLPSIRELSKDVGVNPNTVQKSLADLERKMLITTNRTNGKFVTNDARLVNNLKILHATKSVEALYNQLNKIGYSREEAIILIEYVIENVEKSKKAALEKELRLG